MLGEITPHHVHYSTFVSTVSEPHAIKHSHAQDPGSVHNTQCIHTSPCRSSESKHLGIILAYSARYLHYDMPAVKIIHTGLKATSTLYHTNAIKGHKTILLMHTAHIYPIPHLETTLVVPMHNKPPAGPPLSPPSGALRSRAVRPLPPPPTLFFLNFLDPVLGTYVWPGPVGDCRHACTAAELGECCYGRSSEEEEETCCPSYGWYVRERTVLEKS